MAICNKREWDRSKQTYFILRRGDPWKIMDKEATREVADYPAYLYSADLSEAVCFAADDEAVKRLMAEYYAKKAGNGSPEQEVRL